MQYNILNAVCWLGKLSLGSKHSHLLGNCIPTSIYDEIRTKSQSEFVTSGFLFNARAADFYLTQEPRVHTVNTAIPNTSGHRDGFFAVFKES